MHLARFRCRLAALAIGAFSSSAAADPEWSTGIAAGAAATGDRRAWERTAFWGAVHADVILGRTSRRAVGIGPSLELGTVAFSDVRLLGGPTVLIPLGELLAASITPAGYLRSSSMGALGGVSARTFFGVRAYGYDGYAVAGGIVLGFDQDVGASREHAIVLAAQVDGLLLALPALLLFEWLRGSRD